MSGSTAPGPPGPPGPAAVALGEVCLELAALPELRGTPAGELRALAALCRQPLRVAVTGDVSAGKSTLVNALLATRMAQVQHEETTSQVTWYHHPDVSVATTGTDATAAVCFPLADRIVLGDTPGMNTTSNWQRVTEEILQGARTAAASATAVLYLCGSTLSEKATESCWAFAESTAGSLAAGLNVVLVASKADEVRGDWSAVEDGLLSLAGLPGASAVAVSQQLAESARCGRLTRGHLSTLQRIAAEPELTSAAAHGWGALERAWNGQGLGADELAGLMDVATTLVICRVLPAVAAGAVTDAAGLERLWEDVSGLQRLEQRLSLLARHADVLTVDAVTARLRRASARWGPARSGVLRHRLAELRGTPEFAELDRAAADLALHTRPLRHVPLEDRERASQVLRALPMSAERQRETARIWAAHAHRPGRGLLAQRVSEIVMETCLARQDGPPDEPVPGRPAAASTGTHPRRDG